MFSIAAINDTDSRGQWEPLAPTKEAQEFHLTQTYHEGLLKLQSKKYKKAQELLECVLKDPLISSAQAAGKASDGHLLQLRFLALKNLASVFLQQGSGHYESALRCYLQAVEIDTKDSVVWNQLGTLSCSMGLLSISRWAFEQGLLCSPNNWNCMEKLLEVLIAIRDEIACLSVADLILRHWPSHSRALNVKNAIEETETLPFAPRGIDKLEPKHVRLKFIDKRKATDESLDEGAACKKLNQNLELCLAETSWAALADALLEMLLPLNGSGVEFEKALKSGDVRLTIRLPSSSDIDMGLREKKGIRSSEIGEIMPAGESNSGRSIVKPKETNVLEEQPLERRSTRLERLRSRKPGKEEEEDFANEKDLPKNVLQFLESFIIGRPGNKDCNLSAICLLSCPGHANSLNTESSDVTTFVRETSVNHGAYHMGHLLLEHAASRSLKCHDAFVKFLELEKLTRCSGLDRTPECSLYLSELYYDLGSSPSNVHNQDLMLEASYHLCKIIESVSLDYPFDFNSVRLDSSFWIRYFWLNGRLSILDGDKAKAHEQFCISLNLFEKKENMNDPSCVICLPHCKTVKELTIGRILHEINLLEIDFLLEKTLDELIEKEMYSECVTLLAPLLFSTTDVHLDLLPLPAADKRGEGVKSVELVALDILMKACEKTKPMDTEMYLSCQRRKLQILMVLCGMDDSLASSKTFFQKSGLKMHSASNIVSIENSSNHGYHLVAEEIKAILQCISQVKNSFDQSGDYNVCNVLVSSICGIQCLMLVVMCNVATSFLSKKFSGPINVDQTDQKLQCCFVDAAIAFCKLQHLNPTVPVKTQVDLIAAIHDLLAEYGLCCAGEGDGGEDGIFLKFAIKHLLALNMKLKSDFSTANKDKTEHDKLLSHGSHFKTSEKELRSGGMDAEMVGAERYETVGGRKDASGGSPNGIPSHSSLEKENPRAGSYIHCDGNRGEKNSNPLTEEFSEDEREELELMIDNALDQCFYCLYGLNLRSDSSYEDDLVMHRNTSRGDYQTKEQSTDVFQYVLPYAKDSSRTGLVKLRRVLRAIRKHFPQPPEGVLAGNAIDKFLDDLALCEDKLSEDAGSDGYLGTMMKIIFPDGCIKKFNAPSSGSSDPYLEVYRDLYYYLAQAEEMSTTDKWPGFVLTKEGEEFVQQNANLFKFDLLYNPLRFESWQRLANIYDEEVDLLLNDGSKHINVAGWRKNVTLPQRVETSRRRSRRCLLMSLALAKTSEQQCETHELLALVYYDSLQNVVPFYDQRSVVPSKDAAWKTFCEMSLKHFKQAFSHKEDWTHAFYMGKLCQKLGYSYETSLSYYEKARCLNLSAVDALYRMHASRLKLLWTCGKQNVEILTVLSTYSYSQSTKDDVMNIIGKMDPEVSHLSGTKDKISVQVDEVWNLLYNDCLSALEVCVEGDLKHFHKARYMLSQGLYKRGEVGDLEKAKDELSFCFKSSRSSFTINMWEIDGMVKKGRRKTAGFAGNKKVLEVNLPESSRKFITCIRKYLLFYLKLLEETGDVCTLERAYVSLRADKRFSLCIEDLVPVALGRYIRALLSSMHHADTTSSGARSSSEHQLEKIFGLFVEQGNLWPEICGAPEIKSPEISESSLYGYLHEYIVALESKGKLETLEAINEKIRKRFKNPKLSNNNGAKVCRHASVAWCRSLIIKLASITPLLSLLLSAIQEPNQSDGVLENSQLLCVDLTTNEFWNSSFEDRIHLKSLEKKWNPMLSKIKNVIIKKTADENLDTAHAMLRNSYNFYRESTSVALPSGVNLFFVSSRLASEAQFQPGMDGVEILDLSVPRKLLLWAYTLLQGRSASISAVVKHCEENIKSKMKKGFGASPVLTNTSSQTAATTNTGGAKDGVGHIGGTEAEAARHTAALPASQTQTTGEIASVTVTPTSLTQSSASVSPNENAKFVLALPSSAESQRSLSRAPPLHESGDTAAERSPTAHGGDNQDGG